MLLLFLRYLQYQVKRESNRTPSSHILLLFASLYAVSFGIQRHHYRFHLFPLGDYHSNRIYITEYSCGSWYFCSAVKHFCNQVVSGTRVLQYKEKGEDNLSVIAFLTPEGKYLIVAGNYGDVAQQMTVQLGEKYLNVTLQAHSFNTFIVK